MAIDQGLPMLLLRRPSSSAILRFLAAQSQRDFTYSAIGCTATVPPVGYTVDHTRVMLRTGEKAFRRAKAALERWEHFCLGWVEAWPPETPIQPGAVVAERFMVGWDEAGEV